MGAFNIGSAMALFWPFTPLDVAWLSAGRAAANEHH